MDHAFTVGRVLSVGDIGRHDRVGRFLDLEDQRVARVPGFQHHDEAAGTDAADPDDLERTMPRGQRDFLERYRFADFGTQHSKAESWGSMLGFSTCDLVARPRHHDDKEAHRM